MTFNANFDHLQKPDLLMFGLGIENDEPPNALQPRLDDGIHLRWTFPWIEDPALHIIRSLGFPWHGFYLFRRTAAGHNENPSPWQTIPGFSYPLRLPLTHLDYPCTLGQQEDLDAARKEAYSRIRYGESQIFPGPPRPTAYASGSITLVNSSNEVTGSGVNWKDDVGGKSLAVDGDKTAYTIMGLAPGPKLILSRNYLGASRTTSNYAINDDPFGQLYNVLVSLVAGGLAAGPMWQRTMSGPTTGSEGTMRPQNLLGQVQFAALHPAVAQMLGLYWIDDPGPGTFDYLIVADYSSQGAPPKADEILAHANSTDFSQLYGFIVPNQRKAPAVPLPAPSGLEVYALPGGGEASIAGLRWKLAAPQAGQNVILFDQPVMYHVWQARLGSVEPKPQDPAPDVNSYSHLTKGQPAVVADMPAPPQYPRDWPPFWLHYINSGLSDGWYSYRVSGINIFGRHTPHSDSAPWLQWAPKPDPAPWYYKDPPPPDAQIHPYAVGLLDKTPPPPPMLTEAYALDPADPYLLKDAAYTAWWNDLTDEAWYQALSTDEKIKLSGLRVRWRWTNRQMQQAPDTHEFRIYFQPGHFNTLPGKTGNVTAAGANESWVETNIANAQPVDAYVGTWLRIGASAFPVVGSAAGSPLRVRVKSLGPAYTTGTVSVNTGSAMVIGDGTAWHDGMTGLSFQVAGDAASYTIQGIASPTEITLAKIYAGATSAGKGYKIFNATPRSPAANAACTLSIPTLNSSGSAPHPLYVDPSRSPAWSRRYYVVGYNQHVTEITDPDTGLAVRLYEVFLPAPGDSDHRGLPLAPTTADPIVYAQIGVSAADDKTYTPDDQAWSGADPNHDAGDWANRTGNEGRVGAPATVFVVKRTKPDAPHVPPADSDRVYATPADYHSHSFYTYRWMPSAGLKAHIFRALDDAVFQADWKQRPRNPALDPNDTKLFPNEARWDAGKRAQVADELNHLNTFGHDAAGTAQAMDYYRGLSNDGLRILAGLPGNETAFSQLTIQALDPADPANSDRRGPDDPENYTPQAGLRAYTDTLDGRTTSRYFYRVAYVDDAHNRGPLSLSSPPVYLHDVVPPRPPTLIRVTAGDRKIRLAWASNREPDLLEYRVYRAESAEAARDLRLMTQVDIVAADPNPGARPASVEWTDDPVPGLVDFWYRVVAVDRPDPVDPRGGGGNVSEPSVAMRARAYDLTPPEPPLLTTVEWVYVDAAGGVHPWADAVPAHAGWEPAVRLVWTLAATDVKLLVQVKGESDANFSPASSWLAPGTITFLHRITRTFEAHEYRLKVVNGAGNTNVIYHSATLTPPV
jgi:hypothetical protein